MKLHHRHGCSASSFISGAIALIALGAVVSSIVLAAIISLQSPATESASRGGESGQLPVFTASTASNGYGLAAAMGGIQSLDSTLSVSSLAPGFFFPPDLSLTATTSVTQAIPGQEITMTLTFHRDHDWYDPWVDTVDISYRALTLQPLDVVDSYYDYVWPGDPGYGYCTFGILPSYWGDGRVMMASTTSTSTATADGASGAPSLSSNGKWVAFESSATNLVPGDSNACSDVFVRNTTTDEIVRASVADGGVEADGVSSSPQISADGRYVVFVSNSSNLTAEGGNGQAQVYLRDLQLGTTKLVSVSVFAAPGQADSFAPSVSADGRFVVFASDAANLTATDGNSVRDIFLRDMQLGITIRVTNDMTLIGSNGDSNSPVISADGSRIAFMSTATNLVVDSLPLGEQCFVYDVGSGSVEAASKNATGVVGDGTCSSRPSLSADGRYLAFVTNSGNFAADTNGFNDVYVKDLTKQTITRASVDYRGNGWDGIGFDPMTTAPSISSDGRYVAFQSANPSLDNFWFGRFMNDTNGVTDVFVRDMQERTLARASVRADRVDVLSPSTAPSVADSGRVAFACNTPDLLSDVGATDTNGVTDVYVEDHRLTRIDRVFKATFVSRDRFAAPDNVETFIQEKSLDDNLPGIDDIADLYTYVMLAVPHDDVASTRLGLPVTVDALSNDECTYTVLAHSVGPAGHGSASWDGVSDTISYTPDPSFVGTDTFTYTLQDSAGWSTPATVTVGVTGCVPSDDATMTRMNTPVVLNVLDNDAYKTDTPIPAGETVTGASHGAATWDPLSDTISYTPQAGYLGPDALTYRLFDGTSWSKVVTASINVVGGSVGDDVATATAGTPVLVPVTGNDSFRSGSFPIPGRVVTSPLGGAAVWDAPSGSVLYTPRAGFSGADTFTYSLFDGIGWSAPAVVSVQVARIFTAPLATDDAADTNEDTELYISVLTNDGDPDGDSLVAVPGPIDPAHGTVSLISGVLCYKPAKDFFGSDSFTYRAFDGGMYSSPATVRVTVLPVNDPPVARDDTSTAQAGSVAYLAVLGNDEDVDNTSLTAILSSVPSHGTAQWNAALGVIDYTPQPGFEGIDTFSYWAFDGSDRSASPATVIVTVRKVNHPPIAFADESKTAEDTAVNIDVFANDRDEDGDILTATLASAAKNGTVSWDSGTHSFRYVPHPDYHGSDTFTYRLTDGSEQSDPVAVTIEVTPVNDAPLARSDNAVAAVSGSVLVDVIGNDTDVDGDSLVPEVRTEPGHGSVSASADGIRYKPAEGFHGTDSFTYRAYDGQLYSAAARVVVIVGSGETDSGDGAGGSGDGAGGSGDDAGKDGGNDDGGASDKGDKKSQNIKAADDEAWTDFEKTLTIPLLPKVSDELGRTLRIVIERLPAHGECVVGDGGAVNYVPDAGFSGTDSFTYRAWDGESYSNLATVMLHVRESAAQEQQTPEPVDEATGSAESSESPPIIGASGERPRIFTGAITTAVLEWLERKGRVGGFIANILRRFIDTLGAMGATAATEALSSVAVFGLLIAVFFRLFARRRLREDEEG